jgi:hypothetical protein
MLSTVDSLALKIFELDHYSALLQFLPWKNHRAVSLSLLRAIDSSSGAPRTVKETEELFSILSPLIHEEQARGVAKQMNNMSLSDERFREIQDEIACLSKLVHLLDSDDTDLTFEMLSVARKHLSAGGEARNGQTLTAVVFATLRLANQVYAAEYSEAKKGAPEIEKEDEAEMAEGSKSQEEKSKESETQGDTHTNGSDKNDKTEAIEAKEGQGEDDGLKPVVVEAAEAPPNPPAAAKRTVR